MVPASITVLQYFSTNIMNHALSSSITVTGFAKTVPNDTRIEIPFIA